MNNYIKYFGTIEKTAEMVIKLSEKESDKLSAEYCRGRCVDKEGNANCTDGELLICIMRWLEKEDEFG